MSKARDLANFSAATGVVDADISVNVQAYDATILVDADIGVNVQAYDATILVDADIGSTVASTAANTFTGLQTDAAGADLASAATINLTAATGNTVVITGTVATSALTMTAGQQMVLLPSGAWPMTYNATTMNINGGVDQVCAAGDRVTAVRDLAGVIRVELVRQSGVAVVAPTTMTATVGGLVPTPPNNTTTFLRGDGTFGAPAAGALVLIASSSTNGGTSVAFTGFVNSTYMSYILGVTAFNVNSGTGRLRFYVGGVLQSTGYADAGWYIDSGSAPLNRGGNTTHIFITNASNQRQFGDIRINANSYNAVGGTANPTILSNIGGGTTTCTGFYKFGSLATTSAITGFLIDTDNGGTMNGYFRLYGIVNA